MKQRLRQECERNGLMGLDRGVSPEAAPPGGMSGPPGLLLRLIRDQRVAFIAVGAINTVVGYRFVVFRVRGHVLSDLWRFETVYLSALAVNFALLPLLVEIAGLPVLLAQALIVFVTSLMSWVGHKHYSFRRRPSPDDPASDTRGVTS